MARLHTLVVCAILSFACGGATDTTDMSVTSDMRVIHDVECGDRTCGVDEVCVHGCDFEADAGFPPIYPSTPPMCRPLGPAAPGCDYMHRNCCDSTTSADTLCDPNCFYQFDGRQAMCACGP